MIVFIETLDGQVIDFEQYGLTPLRLEISSLSPRSTSEVVDGRDGHIDLETTFDGRNMMLSFIMRSNNFENFLKMRDMIFRLFDGKTYFYLIEKHIPQKRWKVKSSTRFSIEKFKSPAGQFSVDLVSSSPFAESVITTLNPFNTDGYIQMSTPEEITYSFTNEIFSVWNEGDIIIDPRAHYLSIIFKGASNGLTITNITTGDKWTYNGTTTAGDVVKIDGIRSFKNDSSIFGQTNRKLISLVPGWNEFSITGATGPFEISFDFRFLFV